MAGRIRVGVGGWTYEPWRGVFYPDDLPRKQELAHLARRLTSVEINGTYYSTFKPDNWKKWRDETPDDFVFAVKASRYCTNRKVLATAGESVERFLTQGLAELGPKLGPVDWQFMGTKRFEPEDFEAFLTLLPREVDGVPLRHAVEVRHDSFLDPAFADLCARRGVAPVWATGDGVPEIEAEGGAGGFSYMRVMTGREELETGHTEAELDAVVERARRLAERGDVFLYFISAAKVRNPAAAEAVLARLG
jgi:uncharacterized protein YecE (DUF72 family)